jgi:group II intron reverse transcriptase/maturase
MHEAEESDFVVVPVNQPNKTESPVAEAEEGRTKTKKNIVETRTPPTQSGEGVSQGLVRVLRAARTRRQERFTALLHNVKVELLRASFQALKREAAPGVDGLRWAEYEDGLEARLTDLHGRIHRAAYRAQPSRRVYIPKADGRQRPLGIAALGDKIVQQAVRTVLEQIYEADFRGFSYGFRSGRGAHQTRDALSVGIPRKRVNWILDADIRGFFHNMDHEWTLKFIGHRVADKRILRLIQKWLKAGVSEEGKRSETTRGTPRGAVISPLLANVYLLYVFDLWVQVWREKVAACDVIVVRYADDLVGGFQHQAEAERFLQEFRERLAKFGLELHPGKTRLIEFGRFAAERRRQRDEAKPETFTFLGSRTIAGSTVRGNSASGAERRRNAWRRSWSILQQRSVSGCTRRWPRWASGSSVSFWVTTSTRRCRQYPRAAPLPSSARQAVAAGPLPAQSDTADELDSIQSTLRAVAAEPQSAASLSANPLRRHTFKVGAVCRNPARTDLCGGR